MQFTTLTLSALSIGSALAQTVHVVTVGGSNGTKIFSPSNITAAVGDMVQFQFNGANHTVTQSTFDQPCEPIANNSPNVTGMFSGFMSVGQTDATRPAFTIAVTSKTPMWLYCSQATHCQAGMVAVINENTAANVTRSLDNFKSLAKLAPTGLAIPGVKSSSSSNSSSSSSGSSGSSSGSGTSSSGGSTTSSPAQSTNASGAAQLGVSGSLLALGMAALSLLFI